jgi:hypothetical protein
MSDKKEPTNRVAVTEPKVVPAPASSPASSERAHGGAQHIAEHGEPVVDAKYGYLVGDGDETRFFYYCAESRQWHQQHWDGANLTRPGERCCADDQILLELVGEADHAIREAIELDRPPPGSPPEWDRGRRVGGGYLQREGIELLKALIDAWERNGPSGFAAEALGRLRLVATLIMACGVIDRVRNEGYAVVREADVLNIIWLTTHEDLTAEQAVSRLFPRWPKHGGNVEQEIQE